MTDNNYPITPPPAMVQQWASEFYGATIAPGECVIAIATQSARWGADQELEACCADIHTLYGKCRADWLRAHRRPKPPSLKEQALALLDKAEDPSWDINDFSIIRRALEALPE